MRKLFVVAGVLATLALGTGAGVVVAQSTANPSSDVLHDPTPSGPFDPPSDYAEGVTIREIYVDYSPDCNGYGIVTTTRLGDRATQEVVLTDGYEGSGANDGDHCTRSSDASTQGDFWTSWRRSSN